jgi:phage gpG-like protein
MSLELRFSIEGQTQMFRRLEGISMGMKDWTVEFAKVGQSLLKTFRDNFNSQGSLLGSPWDPLSPRTIAQKAKLGFPLNPLVRTTTMREGFLYKPSNSEVIVWNPTPYFAYHQSIKPRSKLPRRVMMKLDEKRKQTIVKIFQTAVQQLLKAR